MKIGVISDTHIPDRFEHIPEAVLTAFKQVDMVMHAGDMVSLAAVDELKSVCSRVEAVSGNMDSQEVIKKFPQKQVFNIQGFKLGLMHGGGAPMNLPGVLKDAFKNEKCDVIIFGHSHKAMNKLTDGVLFFNPGSATDGLLGGTSYGIIEIDKAINAKIIKI